MSVSESSVKRVSNLAATLGQKTMVGSASVVLASDQVVPVTMSSPGANAGFHAMAHIDAGQWVAANLMSSQHPLSGIDGGASAINITSLLVSTDTAFKLALHQCTLADYLYDMSIEPANIWKLDEASGNAADSIGSATLTATATPTYAAESWVCGDGKAVQLNGSTQGFKTTTKLPTASAGAFECWFWLDVTPGATMHIASAADAAAVNDYWRVSVTTARKVNFTIRAAGVDVQNLTSDFVHNLRQWYHLAVTYVGGIAKIYVNGRLAATSLVANAGWYDAVFSVVDNFVLGYQSSTTNTGWFQGKLALAAWYVNAATDADWAKRQYQRGAPIFGPHQFAANGNVALNLGAPITLVNNHSVYIRSTASATATVELIGYDQ